MASDNFRYNYIKYRSKSISLDRLDKMMDFVMSDPLVDAKTTDKIIFYVKIAFTILKLVCVVGYVFSRRSLVEEQMQIEKQEYEQAQGHADQGAINDDDLGSEHRK
jgi:hypothetical protein